jgi:hypothetical protein
LLKNIYADKAKGEEQIQTTAILIGHWFDRGAYKQTVYGQLHRW